MQLSFVPVVADPVDLYVLEMFHANRLAPELSFVDAVDTPSLRTSHKVQISVPVARRLHAS